MPAAPSTVASSGDNTQSSRTNPPASASGAAAADSAATPPILPLLPLLLLLPPLLLLLSPLLLLLSPLLLLLPPSAPCRQSSKMRRLRVLRRSRAAVRSLSSEVSPAHTAAGRPSVQCVVVSVHTTSPCGGGASA